MLIFLRISLIKTFYFTRLRVVFNADDTRTFKLICCKYRRINDLAKINVLVDYIHVHRNYQWVGIGVVSFYVHGVGWVG